jgi:hypothetical protein
LSRPVILAGLTGITVGLGALTWATFGLLLLCGLLAAIPLHRKQPVCPHHIEHSHCRVIEDFHDWRVPR